MGRPTKKSETPTPETISTEEVQIQAPAKEIKTDDLPAKVVELMRLYPQYEEMWITPRGFVHPAGSPEYLVKDATLYKNKFYNK